MENHYSSDQVQAWMLEMSHYPQPPPPTEQHHFNALYPTYGLGEPIFPKVEPDTTPDQTAGPHRIQAIATETQLHAHLEEQQRQQIQQAAVQIQQQHAAAHGQQSAGLAVSSAQPQHATPEHAKINRLRKACDSCSIRKVKCDENTPCRPCAAVDIPCTFDRPSRRRGPVNRHAENVKRQRTGDATGSPFVSGHSSPSSPTYAAQTLAGLSSNTSSHGLSAESICPIETLELLIDDFFTYIHPLCPFPHEPSFREAWRRREDMTNKAFLALLASMIGALVASFPRKPRLHIKAQKRENVFPNHMSLVRRCQQVCATARGPGYLESEDLSVYDAATSYFLGLMGVYTFRWRMGRLYMGECLTIIRTLGLHKPTEQSYTPLGTLPTAVGSHGSDFEGSREQAMDEITLEMGRRIFWTMFVSVKSIKQLGASFAELVIPPPTPTEPYPPLPAEVDDFCIYPDHIEPQPPTVLSIIAGFNANVKVYSSYNALATMEMAWGMDAVVDWERQKRVLQDSLRRCKNSINELPPQLAVYANAAQTTPSHQQNGDDSYASFGQLRIARDPAQSLMSPSQRNDVSHTSEERHRIQYEIQKANIHASSLSTRLYIVEKYFNLCEAHDRSRSQQSGSTPSSPSTGITAAGLDGMVHQGPQAPTSHFDMAEEEMRQEREDIIKDLLIVLGSIDQVNMEPNADSFTMKIRSIASTLLEVPDQRKGPLALQVHDYLSAFLEILKKLERSRPVDIDTNPGVDEEHELNSWADLREAQEKFAQQGGILGML